MEHALVASLVTLLMLTLATVSCHQLIQTANNSGLMEPAINVLPSSSLTRMVNAQLLTLCARTTTPTVVHALFATLVTPLVEILA